MFVGHLALALVGKRADPSVSLGWFMAAVTMLDLLWPVFLLLGVEQVRIVPGATAFTPLVFDSYPWSHSLSMALVWGAVLAGLARWRGIAPGTASLLAALVASHWLLDFITHAPDMPLWPGQSPRWGLVLWNSIAGTLIIEGALWAAAIALYLRRRRATRWIGRVAFWSFVVICTAMWVSGPWSATPPDPRALAWFALIGWIVIPWTALADRYYVRGGAV
ncbi:MAG: metal-dependent hydrolase [Gemmatimonadales bacterium]